MKIRAGEVLCGRKPAQMPARTAVTSAAGTARSTWFCTASTYE